MRGKAKYAARPSGQRLSLFTWIGSAMLVAAVERLIRAFDENFAPLKETGGGKPSECAKDELLEKRGLHR
jgi:hypothetical protein